MNPRVEEVKILKEYKLLITFSNKEKRVFDVEPYLNIGVFSSLKSKEIFNSVRASDGTIQWVNEVDFCPDTLYLESRKIE